MDTQLALIIIRSVEAAMKNIAEAVGEEDRVLALTALTDVEHELAALRQILEEPLLA